MALYSTVYMWKWKGKPQELVLSFCHAGSSAHIQDFTLGGKNFDHLSHLDTPETDFWLNVIWYVTINLRLKSRQFESETIYPKYSTTWLTIRSYLTSFQSSFMKNSFAKQKIKVSEFTNVSGINKWHISMVSSRICPSYNVIFSLFVSIRWLNIH